MQTHSAHSPLMEGGSTQPSPTIRPAHADDLAEVERLLRASALPTEGVAESFATFHVAEQHGAIVGVAGLELLGGDALLRSVAVSEDCRGTGVGRALVKHVLAEAGRMGVRDVYLLTTTAERWFPAFGFEVITRSDLPEALSASGEVTGVCPASAIVMRLPLAQRIES